MPARAVSLSSGLFRQRLFVFLAFCNPQCSSAGSLSDLRRIFGGVSPNEDSDVWIASASLVMPLLSKLVDGLEKTDLKSPASRATHAKCTDFAHTPGSKELGDLLDMYQSDKATPHLYHYFYAHVISQLGRENPLRFFEIGLGTNTTSALGSMGSNASPGASLRAFRDFMPASQVFGADLDETVLFSENRIKTMQINQLKPGTYHNVFRSLGQVDIIIDDGLHSFGANLNTVVHGLPFLRGGGWLIVEDIKKTKVVMGAWKVADALLSTDQTLERYFIDCGEEKSASQMYAIRKKVA
mmetsp:Transcript_18081/g.38991  ORF Transcript_18081/g.38991 Transcript_18081/m.38991 type:complete len:297 (-) Transcript_18081:8-898(-)